MDWFQIRKKTNIQQKAAFRIDEMNK